MCSENKCQTVRDISTARLGPALGRAQANAASSKVSVSEPEEPETRRRLHTIWFYRVLNFEKWPTCVGCVIDADQIFDENVSRTERESRKVILSGHIQQINETEPVKHRPKLLRLLRPPEPGPTSRTDRDRPDRPSYSSHLASHRALLAEYTQYI